MKSKKSRIEAFSDLFEGLARAGLHITPDVRNRLETTINDALQYEPTIALIGRTGAGKSSLCNVLFGECKFAEGTGAKPTTIGEQSDYVSIGSKRFKLIDLPGIGEKAAVDDDTITLYRQALQDADISLLLVKADDPAMTDNERVYNDVIEPLVRAGQVFRVVVTQCRKLNPIDDWNSANSAPGPRQKKVIKEKINYLMGFLDLPRSQIIPVSVQEGYNTLHLIEEIIFGLPKKKMIAVVDTFNPQNVSENARVVAEKGFSEWVLDAAVAIGRAIDVGVSNVVHVVDNFVSSVVSWFRAWW